jgi:hypothetical protein
VYRLWQRLAIDEGKRYTAARGNSTFSGIYHDFESKFILFSREYLKKRRASEKHKSSLNIRRSYLSISILKRDPQ